MDNNSNLFSIVDTAVKDISKRVAKLNIQNAPAAELEGKDVCALYTTTNGDYALTIVFSADCNVLRAITENMKRGQTATEEEIAIYTIEYFNILCGHVVTTMNRAKRLKARFDVPQIVKGTYEKADQQQQHEEFYYNCPYGCVKVETYYQCA